MDIIKFAKKSGLSIGIPHYIIKVIYCTCFVSQWDKCFNKIMEKSIDEEKVKKIEFVAKEMTIDTNTFINEFNNIFNFSEHFDARMSLLKLDTFKDFQKLFINEKKDIYNIKTIVKIYLLLFVDITWNIDKTTVLVEMISKVIGGGTIAHPTKMNLVSFMKDHKIIDEIIFSHIYSLLLKDYFL